MSQFTRRPNSTRPAPGDVGMRLLSEVTGEGKGAENLAKVFFSTLRFELPSFQCSHFSRIFHIRPLDRIICSIHQHHSSRHLSSPAVSTPSFPLPTIELSSTTTCSGKTHLLYYITALAVLPASYTFRTLPASNPVFLNGKSSAIIIIDCGNRFDPHRLYTIIYSYILQKSPCPPSREEIHSFILTCTSHVHILRPDSTPTLLTHLASTLPAYLLHKPPPSQRPISSILIDGLSSFSAIDNLISLTDPSSISTAGSKALLHTHLLTLQSLLHCTVIYTSLLTLTEDGRHIPLYPLPFPSTFATMRLIVSKDFVPPFPTLAQALKDKDKRQEVVDRGGFSGYLEKVGRAWGGMEALDYLKRQSGNGRRFGIFRFRIAKEGLYFEDDKVMASSQDKEPEVAPIHESTF